MDEEFVCEDAADGQEVENGGHEGQDCSEFEDDALGGGEVPCCEPDLETQEQEAGDDGHAQLQAAVLEKHKGQQVCKCDGDHQAQEIYVVGEVDGFLGTCVTYCYSQGAEEKGGYYSAGKCKI